MGKGGFTAKLKKKLSLGGVTLFGAALFVFLIVFDLATKALAEKYLAAAEKTVKDEYVAPVMNEFLKYAALTEGALGVGVDMDKDFRVRYERNGEYRSEKHLSAGQRAVLNLCLRLAIAKQAFKTESPFVVMDDPFVALDEKHFARVKEVLKDLSSREQIIYFTCHPSRSVQGND